MSAVANKVDNLRKRAITSAGFGHIEPHPPPRTSPAYDLNLATLASRVLYRSGLDPSGSGGPLLILCAAAFPDTRYVDYNKLLPYVLSELPGDEELLGGMGYSVVFFAGGGGEKPGGETYGPLSPGVQGAEGTTIGGKWNRPAWSWSLQAYNLLSRAVRKNIRKLWIVHERAWVRILFEAAQTVVSPKFKKKVVHVNSLSELATHIPLQSLNIPPQVYLHDRKINPIITVPNHPPPMFGVQPFPPGEIEPTLPLVLIESSRYIKSTHLKTEGLFRISCSMQLLEIVREAYDRGQYMRSYDYGPHVAAGLIKLYYRSLPEPLIPKRYYRELPEKCKTPEGIKALLTAHEREGGLPSTSRILLTRHLLPLLAAVAAHSSVNKMTPENLAICVSPSLVRSEDPLMDITISRGSVCQLIKHGVEHIDEVSKGKQTMRQGKRELNTKKDLGKLIILDDEGDGWEVAGKEKGLGGGEQEEIPPPLPRRRTEAGGEEQQEVPPTLPKRLTTVKGAEGSPLAAERKNNSWNSEFGGPLPIALTKPSTSTSPQASQQQQPSSPVPPMIPIEGIPLSLQPALQPVLANPSFSEPLIPPPLSEQPTPNLPPIIPPKPTALSTAITPSPLIPLPAEAIAPPGQAQQRGSEERSQVPGSGSSGEHSTAPSAEESEYGIGESGGGVGSEGEGGDGGGDRGPAGRTGKRFTYVAYSASKASAAAAAAARDRAGTWHGERRRTDGKGAAGEGIAEGDE
ncbi:RhoGAP-domain-containing protein [Terfezia boudieri ATCC MYA-4762]|uniref:RhoGAP-domain-containing protein n=1 Tax=Terfezia boudieri ATCC MYA-4762 TaxID=1051890 RepID=A0A3N4M0K8_9PEZI|nr:RhoGAP-domain-containing protein [Terfezia boudieri ATCC MYA-4762]